MSSLLPHLQSSPAHWPADTGMCLCPEDISSVTSLSHLPLTRLGPSVQSKVCEFITNKICYNMKWEMASDEKCITALTLLKLFALSAEESILTNILKCLLKPNSHLFEDLIKVICILLGISSLDLLGENGNRKELL